MAKLNAKATKLLVAINAATINTAVGASQFLFASKAEVEAIDKFQKGEGKLLVEFNEQAVDPSNKDKIAYRTTADGQAYVAALPAAPAAGATATEAGPKPTFDVETTFDLPDAPKTRTREAIYPFATMAGPTKDGDKTGYASFFVPMPDGDTMAAFKKKFNSTISSAHKRFNKEGSTDKRTFTLREAEKDGKAGVRVYRTA